MSDRSDDTTTPPSQADWLGMIVQLQEAAMSQWASATGVRAGAFPDMAGLVAAGGDYWREAAAMWAGVLGGGDAPEIKDKRFTAPEWSENKAFDLIRQSYLLNAKAMLRLADAVPGLDEDARAKLRFATQSLVDALSPANFLATNPVALRRAVETKGESLAKGMQHLLDDLKRQQLTHVDRGAFELGRNIATTPGKVVHETPLFQLIQYAPATEQVLATPLVIFPPWINRFYILDLNPQKSFVKWCVEQGVTVFMVSWKSADDSIKDVIWDDYIAAQIEAIDTANAICGTPAAHTIGYCVSGTTLGATLALLAARGQADKVRSATFFTAQLDFELAGELKLMTDKSFTAMLEQQMAGKGYLDGRVMVATFNALRSRDLIWNYVANNYLLGEDYPAFDLLYWNGDSTNLPGTWQRAYLADLYRDNKLMQPGAITVDGTPIDLTRIETPVFMQAGRDDHIAPAASVWRGAKGLRAPVTFLLAGSGHIAGVVNPPAAQKYQYWLGDFGAENFEAFVEGAEEVKGSWWPYWIEWLRGHGDDTVQADGARVPGEGSHAAIEDAPGRYVREQVA